MEKEAVFKSEDELIKTQLREQKVNLSNMSIIDLAYLTKEMIDMCLGHKLSVEQANCYLKCFYICRELLKQVDPEYLRWHSEVAAFYRDGRELSGDSDRLRWQDCDSGVSRKVKDERRKKDGEAEGV